MICAKCKADVEFDSFFCDQCGIEILICPTCRNPKTGKVCTTDGTKLVTAKDFAAMKNAQSNITSKTEVVPDKPIINAPTQPAPQVGQTQTPQATSGVSELKFVNNSLNLILKLNHDDIIGRKQGPLAPLLSSYNQLSGKHAQIKFLQGAGWHILDLDSSNGTTYNGKKLQPMILHQLVNNTKIILANIEFLVQISSEEVDLDKTVRI
jgi:pSer/pThr/pTyr-binding forkhead associated (FHA) protein